MITGAVNENIPLHGEESVGIQGRLAMDRLSQSSNVLEQASKGDAVQIGGNRSAHRGSVELRQVGGLCLDEQSELAHDATTLRRAHVAPLAKGLFSIFDGLIDVLPVQALESTSL